NGEGEVHAQLLQLIVLRPAEEGAIAAHPEIMVLDNRIDGEAGGRGVEDAPATLVREGLIRTRGEQRGLIAWADLDVHADAAQVLRGDERILVDRWNIAGVENDDLLAIISALLQQVPGALQILVTQQIVRKLDRPARAANDVGGAHPVIIG